ncbi:MAG TPA: hypothetical protein VK675_03315 [Candidatus Paceibacterota bacterium]|nr:hypothetical protein [Candidatus Paceibacterota bacterium]
MKKKGERVTVEKEVAQLRVTKGTNDIFTRFVRNITGDCDIIISLGQKPERAIRVSIHKFFRVSVFEDFFPEEFVVGDDGRFLLLRSEWDFPPDLYADLHDGKATVTVEEVEI